MRGFIEELRYRNVFRVAIAYVVAGWLIAQVADLAADAFNAPDWVMQMLIVLLLLGLPVALFLAWAYELTPEGVLSRAQSELDEQLYSRVFESITSDSIWVGHVLKDMDIEPYAPAITISPEPTPSPEPSEPPQSSSTSVYNVHYEYEDMIEETIWTINTIGQETVDDIDCCLNEYSFDAKPQRNRFVAQLDMAMDIVTESELIWVDAVTLQQVKRESSTTQIGMTVVTTNTYTYEGDRGAPFSKGKEWAYTLTATPQIGSPEISIWTTEVMGTEEITVPAGTFNCYKVVHTNDLGLTNIEWWSVDADFPTPIKRIDKAINAIHCRYESILSR